MEQFLQEIFNKAQQEKGVETLRGKCEYISEVLLEDYKYQLSYKSLERYYKKETSPKGETKDILAKYLGYDDFKNYILKNQKEEATTQNMPIAKRSYPAVKGIKQWFLVGLIPIIVGAGYVGFINGKEKCMVWNEDHFEAVTCTGAANEEMLKDYKLKNFQEIEVSDTTTFFKNGKVQVWYDKHDKGIYYFTQPGINPESGKTLKPITHYMIKKYVYSGKN